MVGDPGLWHPWKEMLPRSLLMYVAYMFVANAHQLSQVDLVPGLGSTKLSEG